MSKKFKVQLLGGLPLLLVATPALSQQAAEKPQASPGADQDAIVVTAQKREQSIQDVPISIAVVSGEQLSSFHAKDMADVAASVPNLYVQRLAAADVIYIRGFGSSPSNFSFDQSVSLYQDGIYAGRGKQFEAPFFDIERIEVLRGPQGALFGKNTPAGAISIVTANPTSTFEAGVTGVYNFSLQGGEATAYVSGPLSENFSARLAVKGLYLDGFIPNRVSGNNDNARRQGLARVTLRYDSGDFDATAKLEYSRSQTLGISQVIASATVPGVVTEDRFVDNYPYGFRESENIESKNVSLTANYQIGDHTLTSVTGYSNFAADRTNSYSRDVPAIYLNRVLEDYEQASQEIRLSSPTGKTLEYIVGGYFDWSSYVLDYPKYYDTPGGVSGSIVSRFRQTARTYSAFAQLKLNATPYFRVIGSARYTRTEKDGTFATVLLTGAPLGRITTASGSIGEGILDPSATVQFDASDDIMLYASYGRGSKSGGFVSNTVGTVDSTFIYRPERSTNYEVGVKSTFFDRKLTVDVSAYYLKFTDLQTSTYDSTLTPPGFLTKNAAAARSAGIEWSIAYRPIRALKITWNGAYQDAKYTDFPGAACLASQPLSVCNPAAPVGAANNPANNNIAGYPLTFSSEWSGSAQVQYTLPIGSDYELTTTGQMNYRSHFFNSDDQNPIFGVQGAYQKYDLRAQFGKRDDGWSIALVGRNITDVRTYTFAFFWPGSLTRFPTAQKFQEEPRTISIEGKLKF
jgi:iron complex outermembrane receptor protein